MNKKLLIVASVLFLSAFGLVAGFQYISDYGNNQRLEKPLPSFELKDGSTATRVLQELEKDGLINNLWMAKLWLKLHPEHTKVKKGFYDFAAGLTLEELFVQLNSAKVKQFSVALIEGLTYQQWLQALDSHPHIVNDVSAAQNHKVLYRSLIALDGFCENDYESLEGCLLADTYFFDKDTPMSVIIQRAYLAMANKLPTIWNSRFLDTAYKTPYELLIMASIIEKETAVESERGIISGVFDNRLAKNMRLQTDPTVIYGIKDFDGNITRKHLREKTPYNTYVIRGLPITPIAMAGEASLLAAAQPEMTDAIYFVAKGDGTHQFSQTLEEHNAAVRKYQLRKGK
jgi:UPF0755 protein